jgi:hypothetical protein
MGYGNKLIERKIEVHGVRRAHSSGECTDWTYAVYEDGESNICLAIPDRRFLWA